MPALRQVGRPNQKESQFAADSLSACGDEFSTQWAESAEDKALPRGAVVSERFETARNFVNKLWNAARFTLLNLDDYQAVDDRPRNLPLEDRWLLSRLATVTGEVTERWIIIVSPKRRGACMILPGTSSAVCMSKWQGTVGRPGDSRGDPNDRRPFARHTAAVAASVHAVCDRRNLEPLGDGRSRLAG
jgi:hypothetical protein